LARPSCSSGRERSAAQIGCSLPNFLQFGFQACPVGTTITPEGFLVTPQGVVLSPQGTVLGPNGQIMNPQGQPITVDGQLVSCVAQRAPRGRGEGHGQIVRSVAHGDVDGPFDDPDASAAVAQCVAELGNSAITSTGSVTGPMRGPGDDDRDHPGQGRGHDGGDGPGHGRGQEGRGRGR